MATKELHQIGNRRLRNGDELAWKLWAENMRDMGLSDAEMGALIENAMEEWGDDHSVTSECADAFWNVIVN